MKSCLLPTENVLEGRRANHLAVEQGRGTSRVDGGARAPCLAPMAIWRRGNSSRVRTGGLRSPARTSASLAPAAYRSLDPIGDMLSAAIRRAGQPTRASGRA